MDLDLGFNPFTPAPRVEQNDPTDTEHTGSAYDPGDDDIAYHDEQKGYAADEEDNDYGHAYEEYSLPAQNINLVEVVYQDDHMEYYAYWEWSPRYTESLLVHLTPDQEITYWQDATDVRAEDFVT